MKKIKKYIIKREHQLEHGFPIEYHYYTKDGTTKSIDEAKRFFTKIGAYLWLKRNYSRVEWFFLSRIWFKLININKGDKGE